MKQVLKKNVNSKSEVRVFRADERLKGEAFDGAKRLKGEGKSAPKGAPMVAPWAKIPHPTSRWGLIGAPFWGASFV